MVDKLKARLVIAFVVFGVIAALGSVTYAVVRGAANTRQINQERARNIRSACEDVNRRHDATLKQLDALIAKLPNGPKKARAKQGRASTALLINALVPKRNCGALVDQQVSQ